MCTVQLFRAKSSVKFQPNMWQTHLLSIRSWLLPETCKRIQKIVNVLMVFLLLKGVHKKTQDQYLASTAQLGMPHIQHIWVMMKVPELL